MCRDVNPAKVPFCSRSFDFDSNPEWTYYKEHLEVPAGKAVDWDKFKAKWYKRTIVSFWTPRTCAESLPGLPILPCGNPKCFQMIALPNASPMLSEVDET